MATARTALLWACFSIAALLRTAGADPSIPMKYCASVNTADMEPLSYTWQSDGRCSGNCTDLNYALAIVQGYDCWCSNLVPNSADQKPISDCNKSCPGFPSDLCGGDGVFGYMEVVGNNPTGTAPAGGATTTSSSSAIVTSKAETVVQSSTVQPIVTVTLSKSSSTVSLSSTTASNTTTSTKPPSLTTVTVDGIVRTVTATPAPTSTSDPALAGSTSSSGLQTGAIVGIVIGVVGGLAVTAAFLWLWFAKRRRQNRDEANDLTSPTRGSGSPGIIGTPKMGEVSVSAGGPAAAATWDSQAKRRSHLMPVDPRLDPFAAGLYAVDQNRSRESFVSLEDNQDYSRRVHQPQRVLRATNPDPDDGD